MRAVYLDLDISMRSPSLGRDPRRSYARRAMLVWAYIVKRL